MSDYLSIGSAGETLALQYLVQNGYTILETNYHNRVGEIDIIAKSNETYCFIEVKTRSQDDTGDPLESITPEKMGRIHRTALGFIQENQLEDEYCRFDVVGVDLSGGYEKITLIQDAFEVDSL